MITSRNVERYTASRARSVVQMRQCSSVNQQSDEAAQINPLSGMSAIVCSDDDATKGRLTMAEVDSAECHAPISEGNYRGV